MALEIAWERQDEIAVAIIRGRIDGNTTEQLQSELESGMGAEDAALILDFEGVSYINSSGLRVGLRIAKRCRESGRKFGICNLSAATRDIVAISGFDQVIPVFESRNRAFNQVLVD